MEIIFCIYFEGKAEDTYSKISLIWKKSKHRYFYQALWPKNWKKGDAINWNGRGYGRHVLGVWVSISDDKFEYFNLETYIATCAFIFVGKEHLLLFPIHHRLTDTFAKYNKDY